MPSIYMPFGRPSLAPDRARTAVARRSGTPVRKSRPGRKAVLIAGGAVVAAGATVLAVRGGDGLDAHLQRSARFGPPAITCENGSNIVDCLPFTVSPRRSL